MVPEGPSCRHGGLKFGAAGKLLATADSACFAAKSSGRNRVVGFVPRLVA